MSPFSRPTEILLLCCCTGMLSTALGSSDLSLSVVEEPTVTQADPGKPAVTSELELELEFGKPFKYTITATNDPAGFAVRPMPVWMKRKGPVLYGNAVESGEFKITLSALNYKGFGPSKELIVSVANRSHPVAQKPEASILTKKTEEELPSAQTKENK